MNKNKSLIITILTITLLGCTGQTIEEQLEDASRYNEQGKVNDSIIAYKNIIKDFPSNSKARIELADIYFSMGEFALAEKEYSKAIQFSDNDSGLFPKLLNSQLLNLNFYEVANFEPTAYPLTQVDERQVYAFVVIANVLSGDSDIAKEFSDKLDQGSILGMVAMAYVKATDDLNSGLDFALKIEEQFENTVGKINQNLLMARLYAQVGQHEKAISYYQSVYERFPKYHYVQIPLAISLMKNKDVDKAYETAKQVQKNFGDILPVTQILSAYYFYNEDYEKAYQYATLTDSEFTNDSQSQVIAGLSAFKLENFEQANRYLSGLIEKDYVSSVISRALAYSRAQLGYSEGAFDALIEVSAPTTFDAMLLSNAAFNFVEQGNDEKAKKTIERLKQNKTDRPEIEALMGSLKLSLNDLSGLEDLKNAFKGSPENTQILAALFNAYLKENNFSEAEKLVNHEIEKDNPLAHNMDAVLSVAQGKYEKAEISYKQAIEENKDNLAAYLYLTQNSIAKSKLHEAEQYLAEVERLANESPSYFNLLYLYEKASKKPITAIEKSKLKLEKTPKDYQHLLSHARLLVFENKPQELISLLAPHLDASWKNKSSLYWVSLADAYASIGNNEKYYSVSTKWTSELVNDAKAWTRRFDAAERLNLIHQEQQNLSLMRNKWPQNLSFKIFQLKHLFKQNKHKEALAFISSEGTDLSEFPTALEIEIRASQATSNFERALLAAKKLYKTRPSPQTTGYVYTVLKQLGQTQDAIDFLQSHISSYPKDMTTRFAYANELLIKEPITAQSELEIILKNEPRNFLAMNNLAWVHIEQTHYKEALVNAHKAYKLVPSHPDIADTYAWALFKTGKIQQAKEIISLAKEMAPEHKEISEHYEIIFSK